MRLTVLRCGLAGTIVMMLAVPVSGGDLAPAAVSPGAMERFSGVDDRCPTFSWQGAPGAEGYELVVYELPPGFDPLSTVGLDDAVEVIFARLPGGVSSWTPPSESRLARGADHAWFVRALFDADTGDVTGGSDWSEGRFFRVEMAPTAAEVREALEVLAAYAEYGGGATLTSDAAPANLADREAPTSARRAEGGPAAAAKIAGIDSVDTGIAAIRGEVPDPSGETYGVVGISNSPSGAGLGAMNTGGGADLVLDGSASGTTDTLLTELSLDRPSANNKFFSLVNSGSGTLNLVVEGEVSAASLTGDLEWDNLTQVPAGLDDGDDDTTYTTVSPISLSGTAVGLDSTACVTNGLWRWTGTYWSCSQIGESSIAYGAVGSDQIAASSVESYHIVDNSITGADIQAYTIGQYDLAADSVRGAALAGNEVYVYRSLSYCGASDITLDVQCQTIVCNPGPPVVFYYSCAGSCNQVASQTCPNTLRGYLLSIDIF